MVVGHHHLGVQTKSQRPLEPCSFRTLRSVNQHAGKIKEQTFARQLKIRSGLYLFVHFHLFILGAIVFRKCIERKPCQLSDLNEIIKYSRMSSL